MPMGKLSKVLSILKIFSIRDFYLSKSCIIQLHLKSALVCMPVNSKQYVFPTSCFDSVWYSNYFYLWGHTHMHMMRTPGAPCLIFFLIWKAGSRVGTPPVDLFSWDVFKELLTLFLIHFEQWENPRAKYREMHKSRDVSEVEKRMKMATIVAFS